jgi:hypothetical protein
MPASSPTLEVLALKTPALFDRPSPPGLDAAMAAKGEMEGSAGAPTPEALLASALTCPEDPSAGS